MIQPRFRKESSFLGLLAVPVARPEILAAVIILGHTASKASTFHKTIPADSFKTVRKPLSEFQKHWRVVPDILETIRGCLSEDKLRYSLTDST